MVQAKTAGKGKKEKVADGVKISTFSLTRSGPLRRIVNEVMDYMPHPKDMVPGTVKMTVELLEDNQVKVEYDAGYRFENRALKVPPPEAAS